MNEREKAFLICLRELLDAWNVDISVDTWFVSYYDQRHAINFSSSDFDERGQLEIDFEDDITVEELNNKLK